MSITQVRATAFPAQAPEDFFDGRRWAWRSPTCMAGQIPFRVSTEWSRLSTLLAPVTTPLRRPCPDPTSHYRILKSPHAQLSAALYHDDRRVAVARRPESLIRHITWHINRRMIESSCVDHVVLHAAAATRGGITVILPGGQEHGKTTTVAGLLREGYDYVTDEAVAIDPRTLAVLTFPKALSIDDGAWSLFPQCRPEQHTAGTTQWQVPAERLGGRSLHGVVRRPKVVVFPEYVAGTATRASALSPGQAVRRLAECTFGFADRPARNLDVLARVVSGATTAHLRIGSLDDAVLAIDKLVSQTLIEELSR